MTDENSESPKPPSEDDLQSLMGGLDFTPDWAKSEPGVKQPDLDRSRGSRGPRGHGPNAPRKSSRGKLQGVRVKPRREAPPRGGSFHQDTHDSRPQGRGGYGSSRGPRTSHPPRVPVHVDFIPDKKRLSKVVAVIRQTRRVYPMRVVAEKFMENPAFLALKYTVKKPKQGNAETQSDFELFVCKANNMVFSDQAACEAYILEHGIEETYEFEIQQVDPPKGSFPGIGKHLKSGRLIGPPNWHGYQARMDEIREEVDPTCPPEIFARQVEIVREEEVIEAWKQEVSQKRFYREKLKPEPQPKPESPAAEASSSDEAAPETAAQEASTDSEPAVPEAVEPPAEAPASAEDITEEATGTPPSAEEPADLIPDEEPTSETEVQPEESTEEEEADLPASDDRPFNLTREEVEKQFREKHLPLLMKRTQRAIMPGRLLEKMTDPSLLSLTQFHLNRETQRPNSIVFALRPAFKHMRLKVYRFEGELMISSVEPHPIPSDLNVTPEIRRILDYVAVNPHCHAKQALEAVAAQSEEVTPDLVSHFRWLIEKGHLIEFHDETLLVPPAREPEPKTP